MNFLFSIVTLVLAALLAGCDRSSANGGATKGGGFSVPVETVVAALERVEDKIGAVGTLEPDEIVQIKTEVEGRIATITFDEGAAVKKGDVLFQLDDAKLRATLEEAEARLDKARNNLERGRKLIEQNTISQQEVDNAQADFRAASAAVALARARLNDTTIRSPLDGSISERMVSPGKYIDKDVALVTVVDNDPMKIDFSVPERFLPQLRVGQTVNVRVAAVPGKMFQGEVFFLDPRVEPSTRTVKLKARIPNSSGELRPGLFANVELVVGVREQAVVVPEHAIVPAIDKLTVFVVENGLARRREVTLGARSPGKVEIATGVAAGEQVVVAGQQKLADQVPVQATPSKS